MSETVEVATTRHVHINFTEKRSLSLGNISDEELDRIWNCLSEGKMFKVAADLSRKGANVMNYDYWVNPALVTFVDVYEMRKSR